MGEFL